MLARPGMLARFGVHDPTDETARWRGLPRGMEVGETDLRPTTPWVRIGAAENRELASIAAAEAVAAIKKRGMADLMRLDERQRAGVGGGTVGFAGLQGQMQRAISQGEAAQAKRDAERDKILNDMNENIQKIDQPEVVHGP